MLGICLFEINGLFKKKINSKYFWIRILSEQSICGYTYLHIYNMQINISGNRNDDIYNLIDAVVLSMKICLQKQWMCLQNYLSSSQIQ